LPAAEPDALLNLPSASAAPTAPPTLPPLIEQAERLVETGVVRAGGPITPDDLRAAAARLQALSAPGSLLAIHPRLMPPSALAPHLRRNVRTRGGIVERDGFVVEDFTDVDTFAPPPGVDVPSEDVYVVSAPARGDELANASPEEAAAALNAAGRTPLTLAEGMHWVLQSPEVLEPNRCFMTIGSRLRRADGTYDARTPALWISGGTGRDGSAHRGAAKIGWCWWRNRHTWLGFASTDVRVTA
jgi:hypothetical protein